MLNLARDQDYTEFSFQNRPRLPVGPVRRPWRVVNGRALPELDAAVENPRLPGQLLDNLRLLASQVEALGGIAVQIVEFGCLKLGLRPVPILLEVQLPFANANRR